MNDNTALSVINHLGPCKRAPHCIQGGRAVSLDQDAQARDRALGIFRSGLRVAVVKNTRLLTVSFTDADPQRSSRIANAVVEAYLTNHTEARYTATSKASAWLTNQLGR